MTYISVIGLYQCQLRFLPQLCQHTIAMIAVPYHRFHSLAECTKNNQERTNMLGRYRVNADALCLLLGQYLSINSKDNP